MKPGTQSAELSRLELLTELDGLTDGLRRWADAAPDWPPLNRCRALMARLLERAETISAHLDAPLVVATFGGTGTGKSSLVNALVGEEVTETGRQRPTTRQPVLTAHRETDVEALGLPVDRLRIVRCDAPSLREMVLIDCPDPDTTETVCPGQSPACPGDAPSQADRQPRTVQPSVSGTLGRLREILPFCDVLLYTTTQQKYRSARVSDELQRAAAHVRIVFIQTHADLDADVRDDWRRLLETHYAVPEILFIDSLAALEQQRSGGRPTGDFSRLRELLRRQRTGAARQRIRRANLIGLVEDALAICRRAIDAGLPAVEELQAVLEAQHRRLVAAMAEKLADELAHSRRLWEKRLVDRITEAWGFSPFSAVLRLAGGLGRLLAGIGLLRARTGAQLALLGVFETSRQVAKARKKRKADLSLERLTELNLDETLLRDAQLIVDGYAADAQLCGLTWHITVGLSNRADDPAGRAGAATLALRDRLGRLGSEFFADARRKVDSLIAEMADRRAGIVARLFYETLFGAVLAFVLLRLGKNFFYDSLFGEPLLGLEFYVHALFWIALWSAVLVMLFTHRLRRGLKGRIDRLARELARVSLSTGPFPELSERCAQIRAASERLALLESRVETLRTEIADLLDLGARHAVMQANHKGHEGHEVSGELKSGQR